MRCEKVWIDTFAATEGRSGGNGMCRQIIWKFLALLGNTCLAFGTIPVVAIRMASDLQVARTECSNPSVGNSRLLLNQAGHLHFANSCFTALIWISHWFGVVNVRQRQRHAHQER